jgi:hypothetical protein
MTYLVYETSVGYVAENGAQRSVVYTLLCRRGTGNYMVYDIRCAKIGEDFDVCNSLICSETYTGISDNRDKAMQIVKRLAEAVVMPEHLICVVDELIE